MTSAPDGSSGVRRIPYGADFTPPTLGKKIGEDNVLTWLLRCAAGPREAFAANVAATCLAHIAAPKDRRDMASHVVTAMRQYKLIDLDDKDGVQVTPAGAQILAAPDEERDRAFARHIITSCDGQRFLDAIKRYELRGEVPNMEDLSIELGEPATSKNISTMRAWLGRAGVVSAQGPYRVNDQALDALLGEGVLPLFGLDRTSVEYLLAARIVQAQQGGGPLDAVEVAEVAEARGENVRIRRKSLGSFVKGLEQSGHVKCVPSLAGKGGSRTSFELLDAAIHISETQVRELLAQSEAGLALTELMPLPEVVANLGDGTAEKIGRYGEQLAVHLCLMLGLRVCAWRKRAPHSEIDLIAERLAGLSYERWVVQVKNTGGNLDADQVDREVGMTAGLGVSHILFVVPRAAASGPALGEIRMKSRLTPLHIYLLTEQMVAEKNAESLLLHLRRQARVHAIEKRQEAEAREAR